MQDSKNTILLTEEVRSISPIHGGKVPPKTMSSIKKFRIPTEELSQSEKKVLKKLTKAAELLAPLYVKQKDPKYPGAAFYSSNITKEEIEREAKKNPAVLSPYTFVEKNNKDELESIPFSTKFQKELKSIAILLRDAARLSEDKNFQAYLKARAEDLLEDNYDKSNTLWLKTQESKIGCVIGPFDRYLDKLFFQKRAYMAWVGVLDEQLTREMNTFKNAFLAAERKYLPGSKRAKVPEVKIRVEDSAVFSGLIADFLFVGNNLPSSADLYLIKKHGTLLTLFKPTIRWRFSTWIYPTFQSLFSKDFQQRYTKEELEKAFVQTNVLHESCHSLMRYDDAVSRLQEFFPYFDEIYADVFGLKGCGTLLLKDAISERDLEAMILVSICHTLYFYGSLKERPNLDPYAVGSAILLDFLLKGKALQKNRGGWRIDFHRAYMTVSQLSSVLEYYMALGQKEEARSFLKKFDTKKIFSNFTPQLAILTK